MRKLAEKVALVAQICITLVFVLVAILYMARAIPADVNWQDNGIVFVLVCVLAAIYVGLSAYMLYMHFSERLALKNILLYSDSESSTHAANKVVQRLASDCSKLVEGVRVRKVQIRPDEKMGFKMRVSVDVKGENAAFAVDKLRCLLSDSFKNVLGLKFSTIDFRIMKMNTNYVPDVEKADKQASILNAERAYSKDCYEQPIVEIGKAEPEKGLTVDEVDQRIAAHDEELKEREEESDAKEESVGSSVSEQTDTVEEEGGDSVEAVPVDEETATAVHKSLKKDEEEPITRNMYGTPDSPITDDIVVQIDDEASEEKKEASEESRQKNKKKK